MCWCMYAYALAYFLTDDAAEKGAAGGEGVSHNATLLTPWAMGMDKGRMDG